MKIQLALSSSKGNATRIVASDGKGDILIDVGASWTKVCNAIGNKKYAPDFIFITHEHGDHIRGVGVAGRKTGAPIYILEKCYETIINKKKEFFKHCDVRFFKTGDIIEKGSLKLDTFSVRHDSTDIACATIYDSSVNKKLGFLTDTGAVTPLIKFKLKDCDALCIEMDYDEEEMNNCDLYDPALKRRIRSNWGHMSNQAALRYIEEVTPDKFEFIACLHLSENTNSPDIIRKRVMEKFASDDKFMIAPLTNEIILE